MTITVMKIRYFVNHAGAVVSALTIELTRMIHVVRVQGRTYAMVEAHEPGWV